MVGPGEGTTMGEYLGTPQHLANDSYFARLRQETDRPERRADLIKSVRVPLMMPRWLVERVDEWRAEQASEGWSVPSRAEAIRQLLSHGLNGTTPRWSHEAGRERVASQPTEA